MRFKAPSDTEVTRVREIFGSCDKDREVVATIEISKGHAIEVTVADLKRLNPQLKTRDDDSSFMNDSVSIII